MVTSVFQKKAMGKTAVSLFFALCIALLSFSFLGCPTDSDDNSTAKPGAPTAPVVTPAEGQLTVSWTGVTGAASYEVYCGTTDDPADAEKLYTDPADTIVIITDLEDATPYNVWIRAKNAGGVSGFSPKASGTPVAAVAAPAAAAAPAVTAGVGSGKLEVSWAVVSGATSYEVYYNTSDASASAPKWGEEPALPKTVITGLTDGTPYYVWIKAKNSQGSSAAFSPKASETPNALNPKLVGTWEFTSSFGTERYVITGTTFTYGSDYGIGFTESFSGTIAHAESFGSGAGVIIIEYITGHKQQWYEYDADWNAILMDPQPAGNFYGIYYVNLNGAGTQVFLANTSKLSDSSYGPTEEVTLADAKAKFTKAKINDYIDVSVGDPQTKQ